LFTKKSEIVFIGAGKVAHTLIPLLIEKKYLVKGVVSRNIKSAVFLARENKISFYSDKISEVPVSSRIFFITAPDNEISLVAKRLSSLNLQFKDSLFIHTSGSESSFILKLIERKGGITASFHIMQTFPSLKKTEIKNSFAAIETNNAAAEKYLFSIAKLLGLNAIKLSKENKVYYHLAGVFAANFLNANFFSSEELLFQTGMNKKKYFKLFEPIVATTLSNIKKTGVKNSLSGPVKRGDYLTIKKHIAALKKLKSGNEKLLLYSYIYQSLILLGLIKKRKNKLSPAHRELKRILENELKNLN
jgi:predicted short-subunit dehydrogenase-like oxidoreductase (DUF2520 family)